MMVSFNGGACLATNSVAVARSMPTPGWTITATKIASVMAMAVVAI